MSIVVIGADAAVLEGVAQALAAAGLTPRVAPSLAEAAQGAGGVAALVAVMERDLVVAPGAAIPPLAAGGAALLYHGADAEASSLPLRIQRAILADVTWPLERHRLVTLVQSVVARQQATGRERGRPPQSERERPPL